MTLDTLTIRTVVAAVFLAAGIETHIRLDRGLPHYSQAQLDSARMTAQRHSESYKITSKRWPYDLTK